MIKFYGQTTLRESFNFWGVHYLDLSRESTHSSAERTFKMRYLSATVLTTPNENFLYKFLQKSIFLKIHRALFELWRFVTIVYKRQFRGFSTLQLLTFGPQKNFFTKNYWKFEQFLFWNIVCKPPRKICYISKSCHFTNITCFSWTFTKNFTK